MVEFRIQPANTIESLSLFKFKAQLALNCECLKHVVEKLLSVVRHVVPESYFSQDNSLKRPITDFARERQRIRVIGDGLLSFSQIPINAADAK